MDQYQLTGIDAGQGRVASPLRCSRGSEPHPDQEVPWELASTSIVSLRVQDAWELTHGSPEVTIAIIDESFDLQRLPSAAQVQLVRAAHDSIVPSWAGGYHGTRLAELIVGSKHRYPGVCPRCKLLLIQLPSYCTDLEEARAFDLALQLGAAVVCCGWGPQYLGPDVYRSIPEIVSKAIAELATNGRRGLGSLVLFAAGNSGNKLELDGYASHPLVRVVGGITKIGQAPVNLDFGEKVELLAPVSSSDGRIGGPLEIPSGASGATALIAGTAGLVFSANPNLLAEEAFTILKTACLIQNSSYPVDRLASSLGALDAHQAVRAATATTSLENRRAQDVCRITCKSARPTNHAHVSPYLGHQDYTCSIVKPPHGETSSARTSFRERRFNGGEHSFLGLTAAAMLQSLYQTIGDPTKAFYDSLTSPFSAYEPSGITVTYSPNVTSCIEAFFGTNSGGSLAVSQISNYPSLTVSGQTFPFGYLLGLAADIYGQPNDLLSALSLLSGPESEDNHLRNFAGLFNAEITEDFQFDDDLQIFANSYRDMFANFIGLAKKNYSHFSGHNLIFYLAYHLLAVNAAIQCASATSSDSATQSFNNALITEAFALHFLTDMFSAGHSRVPRWAFRYGGLTFQSMDPNVISANGNNPTIPLLEGDANLLSKLLHDYEGQNGCLVMNAAGSTTTKNYVWRILGDGTLRMETLASPSQADLVYAFKSGDTAASNALYTDEPISVQSYMPNTLSQAGRTNLRFFDLITGLVFVSLADVFRHMAQDTSNPGQGIAADTSAGSGPPGLLNYVLERVPFALPIQSGLSSVGITASLMNSILALLASGAAYNTTELSYRLNQTAALFQTYLGISVGPKIKADRGFFGNDFALLYCAGKFYDGSVPGTISSAFEKSWVSSQTDNLTSAFGSSPYLGLSSLVPSILNGSGQFASTLVNQYQIPSGVTLPQSWMNAVPGLLVQALVSNPSGVWGVEP
jgi:hypothetical protein